MGNVEFNPDNQYSVDDYQSYEERGSSGLVGFIMKMGLAKDKTKANHILIIVLIVTVILTFSVITFSGGNSDIKDNTDPIDNPDL